MLLKRNSRPLRGRDAVEDALDVPADIDLCPEGIFGLLDSVLDEMDPAKKKRAARASSAKGEKVEPKKQIDTTVPGMSVNETPVEGMLNANHDNVVEIPIQDLRQTTKAVDDNTRAFSDALLKKIVPLLLSYSTGVNYTQAALRDGLRLDIEFDPGLEEAIKHVGYLTVLNEFLKKSGLPKDVRVKYFEAVAVNLGEKTVSKIFEENSRSDKRKQLNELQAVVRSRQAAQTQAQQQAEPEKESSKIAHGRSAKRRR